MWKWNRYHVIVGFFVMQPLSIMMLGANAVAEDDKAKALRELVESKKREVSERYGQLSPETFRMYKQDEESADEREYFSELQSIQWGTSDNNFNSAFPMAEILTLYPEYLPVLYAGYGWSDEMYKSDQPDIATEEIMAEEWRPVLKPTGGSRRTDQGDSNNWEYYAERASGIGFGYRARMRVKLTGFTLYPKAVAEVQGIQGNVLIGFVIDRSGMLVETEILQSSGHKVLDQAVEQMVQMAQPFEAFPPEVNSDKIGFAFPLSIRLKK